MYTCLHIRAWFGTQNCRHYASGTSGGNAQSQVLLGQCHRMHPILGVQHVESRARYPGNLSLRKLYMHRWCKSTQLTLLAHIMRSPRGMPHCTAACIATAVTHASACARYRHHHYYQPQHVVQHTTNSWEPQITSSTPYAHVSSGNMRTTLHE